jgi:predicted transcriptional regulator
MDSKELPKFEQILLEILYLKSQKLKFFFDSQKVVLNQHSFYKNIDYLIEKGLINKENHNYKTNYSLTDRGYLLAVLLSRIIDSPIWLKNIEHKIISWDFE